MPSIPRLRLYRIIRPSLVLSQSFTDRLWCGQNEKWWIMGRSRDQFGPEGPEVVDLGALRLYGTRLKADGLLAIRTCWKPRTDPIVRRLRARGSRIRTSGPSFKEDSPTPSAPLRVLAPAAPAAIFFLRERRLRTPDIPK